VIGICEMLLAGSLSAGLHEQWESWFLESCWDSWAKVRKGVWLCCTITDVSASAMKTTKSNV